MTISYRSASSATQAGATSVLYRAPVTLEAGDLILFGTCHKYPGATIPTPTGLTSLLSESGGPGGTGIDTGSVVASAFFRESDGSEDAATETLTVSGGNAITSRSIAYSRTTGAGWDIASTYGQQNTAADIWSITSAASIDVAAGDMIVVVVAKNSDADLTHASVSLTAPGVTFGAYTSRHGPVGTTQGDDCAMAIGEFPVTSGSGTVTLSYTHDNNGGTGDPAGVVLFIRLREAGAGATPIGFSGTVPTLIGKQGVSFSQSLSSYFSGSLTPFSYAVQAGALPAGLSLNSSTGEISGTPTGSGTSAGIVIRATDAEANTADTNAFAIGLEANPSTDVGYYAVASTGNANYEHTTASHSFWHDGAWWTFLRSGSNWNLYEESGNVPVAPGDTVDWSASPHLTAVHTSANCTVAVDSSRNKAYVLGFGGGQATINFRVLTYSAGSWSVTESFNVAGTAGVGVGTGTTFANQSKLSLGIDPNGVPYVFAGNPGSGATPANGCHLAWPNNPASLGGTWSFHTIDSGGATEGDASGRFAGVVSQGGTDYIVVCYTDDTAEKVKMAYHAVETVLSNYSSGWTIVDLETTLSVDNHVWAGVISHGGEQVVVTAVKDGDGAGAGQLQLITSQLGAGMTWTHKRHRITNGIADAVPVQESPSRPSCVLDSTNGEVWVFYHSKDSHPYGWVGYKRALLADLLAAGSTTAVFDTTAPRNSVVAIYDASLNAAWNAKTPAHPVTGAMGYFPVTSAVAASNAAGDSAWWKGYAIEGGVEHTVTGASIRFDSTLSSGSLTQEHVTEGRGVTLGLSVTSAGVSQEHTLSGVGLRFDLAVSLGEASETPQHTVTGRGIRFDTTIERGAATQAHLLSGRDLRFDAIATYGAADLSFQQTVTGRNIRFDSTIAAGAAGQINAPTGRAMRFDTAVQDGAVGQVHQLAGRNVSLAMLLPSGRIGFSGDTTDLIYKLLANRQELDPTTGEFRVYDDDGATVLMRAAAWEDAAGTRRYRGKALSRIDRLEMP